MKCSHCGKEMTFDQPSQYVEFEPYIKRSHEEPTDLAKALRIPSGVSSALALNVATCKTPAEFIVCIGLRKKDGKLKTVGKKIIQFLRTLNTFYNRIDSSSLRELLEGD